MLDELSVRNLGIIDSIDLEPGKGLVVVTGETGAGKTMLLGALRLLMGEQGRKEMVGPKGDEAVVDGRFVSADDEFTVRRRLVGEGRSRAYLDGAMVPARALQERIGPLVEVIGQHDQMLLTSGAGLRSLVDAAMGDAGQAALTRYRAAWDRLAAARRRAGLLGGSRRELERELEMARFQADEISSAGFASGDDAKLAQRATRLRNSEALAEGIESVRDALGEDGGAADRLSSAAGELRRLVGIDDTLEPFRVQTGELVALLSELQLALAAIATELEHDPAELARVEERIRILGDLRRKYGETLDEVLAFGETATARAAELVGLLDEADHVSDEVAAAEAAATAASEEVRKARHAAATTLEDAASQHLEDLGMSDPILRFEISTAPLGPNGADRVELKFASAAGLTPGPVARLASGGELSRLVLALRLAAGIGGAQIIAFDEVDTGIGGTTARAMGEKLAKLSRGRQVFCVTHLPQVAAHGDTHYVVTRKGDRGTVARVEGEARLRELSRMLGGLPESERGRGHAAELLAAARP